MTKNVRLFLYFSALMFIVGLWFIGKKKTRPFKEKGQRVEKSDSNLNPTPAFHPDQVIQISWTAHGQKLLFKRSHVGVSWVPAIAENQIQDRLNLLSRIHQRKIDKSLQKVSDESFKIEIQKSDGEGWEAAMNNRILYWINGPFKGLGTELKEDQIYLLNELTATDSKMSLELCKNRVVELGLRKASLQIRFVNNHWEGTHSTEGLGNYIGEWLSKYCTLKPEGLVDESFLTNAKLIDTIYLVDALKQKTEIDIYKGTKGKSFLFRFRSGNHQQVFISKETSKSYEELRILK